MQQTKSKLPFTKSEAKQWAKKNYKGLEGVVIPSFSPDLAKLDEEGIRHDVRQNISQGFFSILCCVESCGMSYEERKKFLETVCDEARGKILVSIALMVDTVEADIDMLKHFEKVGGTHALLGYPVQYYPESEEDIYQVTKEVCDSTNLAMDIYPSPKFNFERFHPSTFPPKLLVPMADIENVVAMKSSIYDSPAYAAQCFRLVGDKILVNFPLDSLWPITIPKYGQQWAGGAAYDVWQSPDNPRLVRQFELFMKGEMDKAMEIFWENTPIRNFRAQEMEHYHYGACYHFTLWKYYQWLVGGNGGMLRQPVHRLYEHDKEGIKAAMKAVGKIKMREAPEEEFYVGRVNYAKGARLKRRAKV
jgi:4-hydroxy-tetrahydrodipicolinate synthase